MEQTIENADSPNSEANDQDVSQDQEVLDPAALKKERDELAQTNRQLFERAKKAEGFVKVDGKWVKAPKAEEAIAAQNELQSKTGELNETQLDYLDLKGITHDDDIAIIQRVMQRTGQTVRQALGDDYVKAKLSAEQKKREVQNATPSSTKRSGQGSPNEVEHWLSKINNGNAQLSDIPDFATRAAVVEAREKRADNNRPSWHQ